MADTDASIITALRQTGRALPALFTMALPWLLLTLAAGFTGMLTARPVLGWQVSGLLLSIGACAILLVCARTTLTSTPLPTLALPGKPLAIYLLGWAPIAGLLYLAGLAGAWLAFGFAALLLGRLSMLALTTALGRQGLGPWRPRAVLRASLGSLGAFVLGPAIVLLLCVPVIGGMAAAGADLAFLEAELPSRGGPPTAMGIASEVLGSLLPLIASATTGFYQGALLRSWQAQP